VGFNREWIFRCSAIGSLARSTDKRVGAVIENQNEYAMSAVAVVIQPFRQYAFPPSKSASNVILASFAMLMKGDYVSRGRLLHVVRCTSCSDPN
jgi:hypothetical protein